MRREVRRTSMYHRPMPIGPTMPPRPSDTTQDAERVQTDLLRAVPVARRLEIALSLSAAAIGLARRSLTRARPAASAQDIDLWFVELHYGREAADGLRLDLRRREHSATGR
jgi:hypothetical protein